MVLKQLVRNAKRRERIHALHGEGRLTAELRDYLLDRLKVPADWWMGLDRVLLVFGVAQLLAGVLFFFAFNWDGMSRLSKFTTLEIAVVGSMLAAWWRGYDRPSGRALVFSSLLFTGILLAVFGQEYQTGADAYELFLNWTLLITPVVLIQRRSELWFLWLVIAHLAIGIWYDTIAVDVLDWNYMGGLAIMAGLDGALFSLSRQEHRLPRLSLPGRTLWGALLVALGIPTLEAITYQWNSLNLSCSLVLVLLLFASFRFDRRKAEGFPRLAMTAICMLVLTLTLTWQLLSVIDLDVLLLFFGFVIIAATTATGLWLKQVRDKWEVNS